MWELIVSFPVLIVSMILESTVFSRVHILHGNADLIMLVIIAWALHPSTRYSWFWFFLGSLIMTYLSALPMYGYFIIYGIIWLLIVFLKRRVWQMPVILMLFLTIFGTFLEIFFSIAALFLRNVNLDYSEIVTQIAIPSLILNLLLAIPVFGIINDIAETIYFRSEKS